VDVGVGLVAGAAAVAEPVGGLAAVAPLLDPEHLVSRTAIPKGTRATRKDVESSFALSVTN
jgi:hypothetical protein